MADDENKVISLKSKAKSKREGKAPEQTTPPAPEVVYCSFCERPNYMVTKMVKGPGVNICSECTMIAVQYLILEDRIPSGEAQRILDMLWNKVKK